MKLPIAFRVVQARFGYGHSLDLMLFKRHRTLLALLDALGGRVGNRDFQKLLFLYCEEWEEEASYEFIPYRFGGFSFTSYADRQKLVAKGLLEESERYWALTGEGGDAVRFPVSLKDRPRRFAAAHRGIRGEELVRETYRRSPWYATRSEIAGDLLRGEPDALQRVQEAQPAASRPGVCTIGYEGRSLEAYLNCLLKHGATLLCDVRRNPLSRKYGFSKRALSSSCEKLGIRYEHLPELGIASDERQELNDQADYDDLFRRYERESIPQQAEALSRIYGWIEEGHRVALTCYELHPHQCHRHCVADALVGYFGEVCQPSHL